MTISVDLSCLERDNNRKAALERRRCDFCARVIPSGRGALWMTGVDVGSEVAEVVLVLR